MLVELLEELGRLHSAWANVNPAGAYNDSHIHQGPFSRCGFVLISGRSGATVLETDQGELAFDPEPGCLVTFPPPLWHRVEPNLHDEPRVTVAFNVA